MKQSMPEQANKRAAIERHPTKKNSLLKGKNYILAIAIDNYVHAPPLSNAVKDAEDIIKVLLERYSFEPTNVTRLYNEAANKQQIFEAFEQLTTRVKETDNIIIYYAGHGYYHKSNKTGHLVPQNGKHYWDYLSNADLKDHIRAIQSHHTFLIVDSCFSGSLFASNRVMSDNTDLSVAALAERVGQFSSRLCLAAGRIEEVADGLHGENSPFAQAVLSYLKTNTAARFPASTLIAYVKRVTPHNAEQTPIGGVLLNTKDSGGEFVFELKKDEVADWQIALATNKIIAYQSFLAIHPDGQYAATAHANIQQLEAAIAWAAIEKAKDNQLWEVQSKIRQIKQFIKKYEGNEQYAAAVTLGKRLETKAKFIKAKASYFDLLTFSKKDTIYKAEALALLAKMDEEQLLRDQKAEEKQLKKEQDSGVRQNYFDNQKVVVQKGGDFESSSFEKYGFLFTSILLGIFSTLWFIKTSESIHNPSLSIVKERNSVKQNATANKIYDRPNEDMVFVEGGTFMMGCTDEQGDCLDREKSNQEVIVKSFYIDRYEVTNKQYAEFLNAYGSDKVKSGNYVGKLMIEEYKWGLKKSGNRWKAQNGYEEHPVVYVTWYGANEYALFYGMRLPSEEEWEFAAKGGNNSRDYKYAGGNIIEDVAWYRKNANEQTNSVGSRKKNELGIYDMSGNVYEWCSVTWLENYKHVPTDAVAIGGIENTRIARGGAWIDFNICEVAICSSKYFSNRNDYIGFRLSGY